MTSPLEPGVLAAVVRHLNDDHVEECLRIVRCHGRRPRAILAHVLSLDASGLHVLVATGTELEFARIPFSRTVTERAELHEELVRLVRTAVDA